MPSANLPPALESAPMTRREFGAATLGSLVTALPHPRVSAQAPAASLRVNGQRINAHLTALSEFGKNPQGGVSRVAYSDFDRQSRARRSSTGCARRRSTSTVDFAGNIIGRRAGTDRVAQAACSSARTSIRCPTAATTTATSASTVGDRSRADVRRAERRRRVIRSRSSSGRTKKAALRQPRRERPARGRASSKNVSNSGKTIEQGIALHRRRSVEARSGEAQARATSPATSSCTSSRAARSTQTRSTSASSRASSASSSGR